MSVHLYPNFSHAHFKFQVKFQMTVKITPLLKEGYFSFVYACVKLLIQIQTCIIVVYKKAAYILACLLNLSTNKEPCTEEDGCIYRGLVYFSEPLVRGESASLSVQRHQNVMNHEEDDCSTPLSLTGVKHHYHPAPIDEEY